MTDLTTSSTWKQSQWLEPHPSLGISLMDHLFNRLDGAYPNRWRASFVNEQAIANWRESWSETFDEEGLTPDHIKAGLRACRARYDWPPSVAEFVKACRPPMNYDAALYEATQQLRLRAEGRDQWSNPAIYWAAIKVGEFDMLNLSHGILIKRFSAALDEVTRDEVHPVPPRAVALPAPGRGRANPEAVRQAVEKVHAIQQVPGNKDWAKVILDRVKRGEKVPIACHDMAKRALGVTDPVAA
ncbi:replication protein P [Ralstonia nicotianae]